MAHGDYTGNQKSKLATQFALEQQAAARRLSMIDQAVEEASQETIDLIPGGYSDFEEYQVAKNEEKRAYQDKMRELYPSRYPKPSEDEIEIEEIDLDADDENAPYLFRASDTVEGVSLGNGGESIFDLKAGQSYRAPKWCVEHLNEKDLVWH